MPDTTGPKVKCAHEACECFVAPSGPSGKYCSEECRRAGHMTELRCNCQHPECRQAGRTASPPSEGQPRVR
jgi:hypothetical protein